MPYPRGFYHRCPSFYSFVSSNHARRTNLALSWSFYEVECLRNDTRYCLEWARGLKYNCVALRYVAWCPTSRTTWEQGRLQRERRCRHLAAKRSYTGHVHEPHLTTPRPYIKSSYGAPHPVLGRQFGPWGWAGPKRPTRRIST